MLTMLLPSALLPACSPTQIHVQLAVQEAEKSRQAAAEQLSRLSLSRRMLAHFREAAQASVAWRALKAQAVRHGRQALLRRTLRGWHTAAARSRQVQVLLLKRQRQQMRDVLVAWLQAVWMQR